MSGIHRRRPGAADLESATDTPAVPLGNDIWMSPGVSNAYAVATDDGRVIVNAGLVFEGHLRKRAFAEVAGPTRSIVITQGHADHWGAVNALRDPETDVVMHRNYRYWRDDNDNAVLRRFLDFVAVRYSQPPIPGRPPSSQQPGKEPS